jgi:uncharacterized protein (DUF362 family)
MNNVKKIAYTNIDNYELHNVKTVLLDLFEALGYNKDNPLGHIIKPGMTVFIKPNWVASKWRESCPHKDDLYCVITHPNIIEVVADFVSIALNNQGKIIIGDNPSIDADFDELLKKTEIEKLKTKYSVPCEILDLRPLVCKDLKNYGDKEKMQRQLGDPEGYTEVNLSEKSLFTTVNSSLFRGVFKQRKETIASHKGKKQLYTFSRSIYDADVYISIPKMKTHHKAGVTLNLKGLVGTIGVKNQLIHWRNGFPMIGGDEYPNFFNWFKGTFFSKIKSRGSWHGNDTIWRMVVDIYHAFLTKRKKYFSIVDGILAGQGDGPFYPNSIKANTIVAGDDLLAVDIVTTRLMGFDYERIPYLNHLIKETGIINKISVLRQYTENIDFFNNESLYLDFIPPSNWKDIKIRRSP